MKRLSLIGSWKRLGVQVGLLAGVGIAFIGGTEPPPAAAALQCQLEGECTYVKPLFMIVADYSTSMNTMFDANQTRWEAAVSAIEAMVNADNGYLQGHVLLGLSRFGHDPNTNMVDTPIPNDSSGLLDGYKLDVGFYDENDPNLAYYECNGEAIKTAINAVGAPINGNMVGIGTWTKGAMDKTQAYIQQTWADHPGDKEQRKAGIVLMTDGQWTGPSGSGSPANENPSDTAANLYNVLEVPTYVVAIGDAMGQAFADEIAAAGGTGVAYPAGDPQQLVDALSMVVKQLIMDVVQPKCSPGLPRIMVLLDASSSMLNIEGGTQAGPEGQTGWDQARDALAGEVGSIFKEQVMGDQAVENLVHLGLAVFGHNMPEEQKLLVDYGPCRRDNFEWALDPNSSCEAPGCTDPWAGPAIDWTFKDGSDPNPPGFDHTTLSHMPKCDFHPQEPNACIGSGTHTHLGLQLIQENVANYKAACVDPQAEYACDANTKFINILVTDGDYNSEPAQIQGPLEQMYADGITTYVIGFGDMPDIGKLNQMAGWGSNGMEMAYDANNQAALQAALANIIEQLTFDPCCGFNNCANNPEPTGLDPDPLPGMTESDSDSDTTDTTTDSDSDSDTDTETDSGVGPTTDDPSTTSTTAGPTTDATTDPTDTEGVPTTTDPTTDGTGESMSGTGETPTTGTSVSGGITASATATAGESETDTDTDTGAGPATDTVGIDPIDDGCGCTVSDSEGETRGLLASLFTLGLAGFLRRRRRAA